MPLTKDRESTKTLNVGDVAPNFTLKGHDGHGLVQLSDFKGKKNVFIAFYPLDWTPD
jgi:peroxiredoxin